MELAKRNDDTVLSYPQHYAAASLKQVGAEQPQGVRVGYPQHYAAASLKQCRLIKHRSRRCWLSAALRCGLIEAGSNGGTINVVLSCYPQHYAAASLKPGDPNSSPVNFTRYPQHYAAASLKLCHLCGMLRLTASYPQHYAAASLKLWGAAWIGSLTARYPQHYAAASLKRDADAERSEEERPLSAALRCGLIEA